MKIGASLAITLILVVSCRAQDSSKQTLDFDFLSHVDSWLVSLASFSRSESDVKIYSPYYEFSTSKIGIGDACIFAISKDISQEWVKDASSGDCSTSKTERSAALCKAKEMFKTEVDYLKENMNIYVVLIHKAELDGPFMEEAEGGTVATYTPIEGSNYYIYKLEKSTWRLVDKRKQSGSASARVLGMRYMEELSLEMRSK